MKKLLLFLILQAFSFQANAIEYQTTACKKKQTDKTFIGLAELIRIDCNSILQAKATVEKVIFQKNHYIVVVKDIGKKLHLLKYKISSLETNSCSSHFHHCKNQCEKVREFQCDSEGYKKCHCAKS